MQRTVRSALTGSLRRGTLTPAVGYLTILPVTRCDWTVGRSLLATAPTASEHLNPDGRLIELPGGGVPRTPRWGSDELRHGELVISTSSPVEAVPVSSVSNSSSAYADVASLDDATIDALARRWKAQHEASNFWSDETTRLSVGSFTYLVEGAETSGVRLLSAWGRSKPTETPNVAELNGTGPTRHAIALSLGGADASFNVVPDLASQSRRDEWEMLERYCGRHSGSFFFVHAVWSDEKLEALEFGISADEMSIVVARFDQFMAVGGGY